ncbi:MAG: ArnT family glycosyltransferase [Pyrinomonadaceae bacterium]
MTKTENQRPKTERLIWILFALVIVAIYFFGLSIPLVGPDEPRYAQVAREMFSRGDWITPTLGGANWFEKPALLYWLEIVSYKIFGVSEFAARFGSAVFGLGTIFSLWILGKFSAEEFTEKPREGKNKNAFSVSSVNSSAENNFANWLALIAASSIGLIVFSRGARFDIILTFPITAALAAFFIADQTENKSSFTFYFCLFTFYFFVGVALLAKGLVGIVLPFAVVAFYFLLSRKFPSKTFIFSFFWGTFLSLLVASIWYAPMYRTHGWRFVDEFFIQQHFQRFVSDKYQHAQPFWFFFIVLPLMTLPWLPFFLAALWKFFNEFFQRRDTETQRKTFRIPHSAFRIFAFAWLLVPLVFFTFSGSKLPGYILPALPAAIILTAESVYKFVGKSPRRKYLLQALAFLTFAAVALSLQFVVPKYARRDSVKSLIETADASGYKGEKITNLYVVSYNAEFYAAGRLVRDADGKMKRYDDFVQLAIELKHQNTPNILVLVPHSNVREVVESPWVEARALDDNGDTAIVLLKAKN